MTGTEFTSNADPPDGRRVPHFRPPKLSTKKAWLVIDDLIRNGFYYDTVRLKKGPPDAFERVPYPTTLEEAKIFVQKYRAYGMPRAWVGERGFKRR